MKNWVNGFSVFFVVSFFAVANSPAAVTAETVASENFQHLHGVSIDKSNPEQLLLATHYGLYRASSSGAATLASRKGDDLMGFAAHPTDPDILYASGHPSGGGNLGVLKSKDGGKSWRKISDGANGPVDFHALDVSKADPNVVYGAYKGLQVSRDGGRSWKRAGKLPEGTIDLAASSKDVNILYAATRKGLMFTRDGGKTWKMGYMIMKPATMVHTSANGRLYAFIPGVGLVMAKEPSFAWKTLSKNFNNRALLHMAVDPANPDRLYATADSGGLLTSKDGGESWTTFENHEKSTPKIIAKGKKLFEKNCQACHGERGVGEKPKDMYAKDESGFVAPPLNDAAHGWHHSDNGIMATILNGSGRNKRMIAWKETLSREDVESLVVYIKSLWSFNSLACQGARHLNNCGVTH